MEYSSAFLRSDSTSSSVISKVWIMFAKIVRTSSSLVNRSKRRNASSSSSVISRRRPVKMPASKTCNLAICARRRFPECWKPALWAIRSERSLVIRKKPRSFTRTTSVWAYKPHSALPGLSTIFWPRNTMEKTEAFRPLQRLLKPTTTGPRRGHLKDARRRRFKKLG